MIEPDAREAKLPGWAQSILQRLRSEVERLRKLSDSFSKRAVLSENKFSALEELITCASKGGHLTCQEIIKVLESYSLDVTKED